MRQNKILRNVLYYSNLRLFFYILVTSLKISYRASSFSHQSLIEVANQKKNKYIRNDEEKIIRYVRLYLRLRKKLGVKDTCLTYSILLCNTLRKFGLDAKISFAAKKETSLPAEDFPLSGHCWVSINEKNTPSEWQPIFEYP